MLQLTAKHNIFIAIKSVDFRKGIDGLAGYCRNILQQDPLSGHVFVFRNKKATAIKILLYDSQGFWLCSKRLSSGKFKGWPLSKEVATLLTIPELNNLLWNCKQLPSASKTWHSIQD